MVPAAFIDRLVVLLPTLIGAAPALDEVYPTLLIPKKAAPVNESPLLPIVKTGEYCCLCFYL
jgi:hypothetical protein